MSQNHLDKLKYLIEQINWKNKIYKRIKIRNNRLMQ